MKHRKTTRTICYVLVHFLLFPCCLHQRRHRSKTDSCQTKEHNHNSHIYLYTHIFTNIYIHITISTLFTKGYNTTHNWGGELVKALLWPCGALYVLWTGSSGHRDSFAGSCTLCYGGGQVHRDKAVHESAPCGLHAPCSGHAPCYLAACIASAPWCLAPSS